MVEPVGVLVVSLSECIGVGFLVVLVTVGRLSHEDRLGEAELRQPGPRSPAMRSRSGVNSRSSRAPTGHRPRSVLASWRCCEVSPGRASTAARWSSVKASGTSRIAQSVTFMTLRVKSCLPLRLLERPSAMTRGLGLVRCCSPGRAAPARDRRPADSCRLQSSGAEGRRTLVTGQHGRGAAAADRRAWSPLASWRPGPCAGGGLDPPLFRPVRLPARCRPGRSAVCRSAEPARRRLPGRRQAGRPALALKDVRLALQAAGDGRFAALACLADEWQQAVDQSLGEQDLIVVTRALEQQGGTP